MSERQSESAGQKRNGYLRSPSICHVLSLIAVLLVEPCVAHDTPVELPPAQSAPESWNVIEQSAANIDELLRANLMRDIAAQLANISGALRVLDTLAANDQAGQAIRQASGTLAAGNVELLHDSRSTQDAQSQMQAAWQQWRKALVTLEAQYPAKTVNAEVYICPMHPLDRHLNPDEKCSICGMSLVRRHLPASGVYQKPGESSLKMTARAPVLHIGLPCTVLISLTKPDGSPVRLDDLIEMHTKKIHMLINDQSLSDYHHEHPQPTTQPGEYSFSFTPGKPGPYRLWADVVPAATGVQEYVMADLAGDGIPLPLSDRETRLSNTLDGRHYDLTFDTQGKPIRARETIVGTIAVTGSDGKGFVGLEPTMGAFAHLVGFSEDGKTVLHIHPFSKTPSGPDDRAGPAFAFKFYAPTAGFIRLYCQVQIGGVQRFVPFGLTVAAPENAGPSP